MRVKTAIFIVAWEGQPGGATDVMQAVARVPQGGGVPVCGMRAARRRTRVATERASTCAAAAAARSRLLAFPALLTYLPLFAGETGYAPVGRSGPQAQ